MRLTDVNFPLTPMVKNSVFVYCAENGIKHRFNENKKCAGIIQLQVFFKNHLKIIKRKAKHEVKI